MTSKAISDLIGMRPQMVLSTKGTPYAKYLCSSNVTLAGRRYGTYLGALMARGLIIAVSRGTRRKVDGGGRLPTLYMLSPLAISIIEERTNQPCQQPTATAPTPTAAAPSTSPTPAA